MASNHIINEETRLIDQLVNIMVLLWFFLSSFALWFSLQRTELLGWGLREYIHIGTFALIVAVGLLRNKLAPYTKAVIFIAFQLVVAVIGVLSFGLMAPAILLFPLICVMLALFFQHNVVVVSSTLILLFVAVVGFGFQSGYLQLGVDANALFYSAEHWFLYVVIFTLLIQFMTLAIAKYRASVHQLFDEINAQKNTIRHLANHDYLTGMPLIQLMIEKFDSIKDNLLPDEHNMHLVFVDLDELKHINDDYGQEAGDICLIHAAKQINKSLDFRDFACRLGDDEFLILLSQKSNDRQVQSKVNQVLKAIRKPFMVHGNRLTISASAGVSAFCRHGTKFSELKRAADMAMYSAKQDEQHSSCLAE